MNLAFSLALVAATLNFFTAVLQFAIARAPGWRSARAFGLVALSATGYSLANLVLAKDGMPDAAYVFAARTNYLFGHLHVLAWYPFVFGGPDATLAGCPRFVRGYVLAGVALALLMAVTGLNVVPNVYEIPVPWAHVTYRNIVPTPLGEWYGNLIVVTLLVPYVALVRRLLRGERDLAPIVAGFTVFIVTAVVEVLVANRLLRTVTPADLGFLAVVAPTALRSLRRFIADAGRLSELSQRLAGEVRDRGEELSRARDALAESERLAALGRLAAGVGHEINNPLTYVHLSLERIDRHLAATAAPDDVREALGDAIDGTHRIAQVVEGLGTYSRRQEDRRALDPRDAARTALKVAGHQLRHVASLETRFGDVPAVLASEPRLVQALVNLLANAGQALAGRGGRIVLATFSSPAGEAVIEIADDGPGIPPEHLAHLSEPYYTTRAGAGGLGLGLFVTRGIVETHGGRLALESAPGRGTTARIVLPAAAVAAPAPPAPAARVPVAAAPMSGGRRPRLLVVDDEPTVLRLLAQFFAADFEVTAAGGGEEALAALVPGAFDALLCDLMMPGVSGIDLARELESRDPGLRSGAVFLTGGAVTPEAQAFVARADVTHVGKPPDLAALRELLLARAAARPPA